MKFLDILQTAASDTLRSKARTFLTIIAILIGALTLTLTNGIASGVKTYLNLQLSNLGARNVFFVQMAGNSTPSVTGPPPKFSYNPNATVSSGGFGSGEQLMLNNQDLAIIKSIPNVTGVVASHSPSPDYISGNGGEFQLALAQQFGSSSPAMISGIGVNNSSPQYQISVPANYVSSLGYNNQSIIGKSVTIGITSGKGERVKVIATLTGVQQLNVIGKSTVFVNDALSNHLNDIQNEGVPTALANTFQTAYATFRGNLTTVQINSIKDAISAKGFSAQTLQDQENSIFSQINAILIVFDIFGLITLLAASFGIINTLYMSVQERTKEIGLMKALGMSPSKIFALFSVEAMLIGFSGSALGVGLAFLAGRAINSIGQHSFLKDFPGLTLLIFSPGTIISVILGITLVSFLAGTLPAIRASRKNPIEALRYE